MQKKHYKNSLFAICHVLTLSVILIQPAFADGGTTKLETSLLNPDGQDSGNAKFEEGSDRKIFSVDIKNQKPNETFDIKIDGATIITITTDNSGSAFIQLDSRHGDNPPLVKIGSTISIIDPGNVILSGSFGGQGASSTGPPAPPPTTPPTTNTPPAVTTSITIPFGAKDKTVTEFFVPSTISINNSNTVTWTNKDNTAHTVTGSSFDSGLISPENVFSHKFLVDGTYNYACQLHPWMIGQVIVGIGGPISQTSPTSTPNPSQSSIPNSTMTSQTKVVIPAGAADKKVVEFFVPNSINIKVTDSVTWTNDDSATHTVTSGAGGSDGIFDSGLLGAGKLFSFTFTKSGIFDYFCQVHPWMIGHVIVASSSTNQQSNLTTILSSTTNSSQAQSPKSISSSLVPSKVIVPSGAASKKVTEYFVPKTTTIEIFNSVMWTNSDSAAHTVTSGLADQGVDGLFDSGLISPGKSFTFKFTKVQNIDYFCMVHPWMTGQVIVKEAGSVNGSNVAIVPEFPTIMLSMMTILMMGFTIIISRRMFSNSFN